MKKINKIMLLSITAFVPLATVVACSKSEEQQLIDALNPKISTSKVEIKTTTAADTTILVTLKGLPETSTKEELNLNVVGKTDSTKTETIVASNLENGVATFKFTNLTAGVDYKINKLALLWVDIPVPTGKTAEFKVTA